MKPESADWRVVVQAGNLLGESPVWDDQDAALWWIDIHGRTLHRWSLDRGHGAWPLAEQCGCIALCEGGGLVAATRTGFLQFDPLTGEREPLQQPLAGAANVRFNDGRCDRQGRFWSGTVQELREVGRASLYRLDGDGSCVRMLDGVTVSNGIAFSPDSRTMYFADSHVREMYAIEFDAATGELGERRLFHRFPADGGMPDGATVDAQGGVWIAAIHGGRVLRFSPQGELDRAYAIPVSQPTSCQFGGEDLRTLFVTSARMRLDDTALRREPLAGSVFAMEPGVAGLVEPRFRQEASS